MATENPLRQAVAPVLIDRVSAGLKAAQEGEWTPDIFERLNRRDFEQTLSDNPSALDFSVALDELSLRAEAMTPAERATLLSLISPLPEALRPARNYFKRIEPELQRIRELQIFYRATLGQQMRRQDAGLQRVTVFVMKDDAEKIRALAADLNRRSGVDKLPRPKRGRPPRAKSTTITEYAEVPPKEVVEH
jgi:hypothetical protein